MNSMPEEKKKSQPLRLGLPLQLVESQTWYNSNLGQTVLSDEEETLILLMRAVKNKNKLASIIQTILEEGGTEDAAFYDFVQLVIEFKPTYSKQAKAAIKSTHTKTIITRLKKQIVLLEASNSNDDLKELFQLLFLFYLKTNTSD